MAYPRLPLGRSEQDRKVAQTVNHLLDQFDLIYAKTDGAPTAGQSLIGGPFKFPISKTILASHTIAYSDVPATASATANITVGGAVIGTLVWPAASTETIVTITSNLIPARTEFDVVAPDPADATLSGIHTSIALEA